MTLFLRIVGPEHLDSVQRFASNPKIGQTSNVPYPYPADGSERWLERVTSQMEAGISRVFAIECATEFQGVVTLNLIDLVRRTAHVDYWVAVPFQGRGIATAAVGLCLAHGSEMLGIQRFESSCLAANKASAKVLENNRFIPLDVITLRSGKFAEKPVCRFVREA